MRFLLRGVWLVQSIRPCNQKLFTFIQAVIREKESPMRPTTGALIGLLIGSAVGWLGFGTATGAIGLGSAVAASMFGLLSAFDGGKKN